MSRAARGLAAGLGLLLVMSFVGGDHESSLWPLVGRVHPLLVHFPLGVLLLALGADAVVRWRSPEVVPQWIPFLLLCGAWSAIAAGIAGVVLADWGSYDPAVLLWHRRIGLFIPVLAAVGYWLRSRSGDRQPRYRVAYATTSLLLAGALVVGGHLGGTLSRGDGFLTRHLPDNVRQMAGLPGETELTRIHVANAESTPVYDSLIQPLLAARCGSCHNPDRKKGGLILTNADGLLAGGRQGKVIVPGRADESEIVIRLSLPPGHTDAMPPDRPMPSAEIAMLRWWIDQGASTTVTLSGIGRPASIRRTLVAYGLDNLPEGIFAQPVVSVDSAALRAARATGLTVLALGTGVGYLSVNATNVSPTWNSRSLEVLRPLAANVASVDLARAPVGDSALTLLGTMPRLTRLQLSNTRVSDGGLEQLRTLQYLEYLNLVNTDVTDQGLRALEPLSRLRTVHLWGTHVTAGGVQRLQRALPHATITAGPPVLIEPTPKSRDSTPPSRSAATP